MSVHAFTFGRDISVTVTGELPIDGYKALLERIQDFEDLYEADPDATVTTPADLIATSKTPFRIYKFSLTTADLAAGTYAAEFIEYAPNVESLQTT